MEDDIFLKRVRLTDDVKLEIYQQGRRRKYAKFTEKVNGLYYDTDSVKSKKYDISLSDYDVIVESISNYSHQKGKIYEVIQDPWVNDPIIPVEILTPIDIITISIPEKIESYSKLIIEGLPEIIQLRANEDLPEFSIYERIISGTYSK